MALKRDQRDDSAAEASAGKPRAVDAFLGTGNFHEGIELGRAVLEVFYRATVRLSHQLAQRNRVMAFEMVDRLKNAFVLTDDMCGAALHQGRHHGRRELLARRVTQGANSQNLGSLETLVTTFVILSPGEGMLDTRMDNQQPNPRRKGQGFDGLRSAIQKNGVILFPEDGRYLVQQAAANADVFVLRLAA